MPDLDSLFSLKRPVVHQSPALKHVLGAVINSPHNITAVRVIACDFNTRLYVLNNILDGNLKEKTRFKLNSGIVCPLLQRCERSANTNGPRRCQNKAVNLLNSSW